MVCKYCKGRCIKKGFPNGKQNYQCKSCKKNQQKEYVYRMCTSQDEQWLVKYNNEGMSISSMGRLTGISKANIVIEATKIRKKFWVWVFTLFSINVGFAAFYPWQ